jgi:high-affinity iron transporter
VAFDVSGTIAPDGFIGALLRGIFNLHPTTSWAQAIAWLLYVVPVMIFFLRPQRPAAGSAAQAIQERGRSDLNSGTDVPRSLADQG